MRRIMVRYTVKTELAERNEELVREVYRELHERQPGGFHYATFRIDGGTSFVHIAQVDGDHNPLAELPAFKAFQEGISERCEEPPVSVALTEVGSFQFLTF
jgi:hypothetical protein